MQNGGFGSKNSDNLVLQRSLEEENKRNIEMLHQNINELQSIGIEIKDYITNEKQGLNKLGDSYDSSKSLLDFAIKKIDFLMESSYGKITCYLVLVVIIVLIILYFLKP